MARREDLGVAKANKKDEFYTQIEDISTEMWHYEKYFDGATIFCNCDDPFESNFFKYFALNFHKFNLKKLICTCYDGSPIAGHDISFDEIENMKNAKRKAYKIELTDIPDMNNDGTFDIEDVEAFLKSKDCPIKELEGNGDFRSNECISLLEEATIVCTNPPFSLFREYMEQLHKYNKNYIILGTMNALKYKEIFPLIRDNKMWVGYGFNLSMIYKTAYPNTLEANRKYVQQHGYDPDEGYVKVPAICWYTNLDVEKRHEGVDLYKHYTPEEFPTYENFDAIEVGKVADIPVDYMGKMGVPISFMDKYNPEQFEIIGYGYGNLAKEIGVKKNYRGRTDLVYMENGKHKSPYGRLIIRRRNQ